MPPENAWPDGGSLVDLNREGSIHVRGQTGFMSFDAEKGYVDRHGALKRIEEAVGVGPIEKTPASSPASLTFRAIYRFLAITLNEREYWDVRNQRVDGSGAWPGEAVDFCDLSQFHTAAEAVRLERRDDRLGDRRYHFWVLGTRPSGGSLQARVVLDTDGHVHLPTGRVSLVDEYARNKRKITPTTVSALGTLLP